MNRTVHTARALIAAAVTVGVLAFGATTAWASSRSTNTCSTDYPGNGVCLSEPQCYQDCFAINQGGGYCSWDGCCVCEY